MPKSGPQPLRAYLSSDLMERLDHHLELAKGLEAAWRKQLGPELATYGRPISYRAGQLTVEAGSSAFANRLRYQRARLMAALREDPLLVGLVDLKVRVNPAKSKPLRAQRRVLRSSPSEQTVRLLKTMAEEIGDTELSDALEKLGSTLSRRR